jgi:hypothetical protein
MDGLNMTELEAGTQPFTPDEAWIEAFKEQCTDDMCLAAKRFAMRRLRGVGKVGRAVSDDDAQDLVQDAIADTLFGILAWDPSGKSLKLHIEDAITSRARREYKRAKKYRHERMDALQTSAQRLAVGGEVEASLQMDREDSAADELVFGDEVVAKLREMSSGDALVQRFLDAIVEGARSRADIMDFAKMSLKTYRNARARLRRLIDQLDQQTGAALRRA